MSQSQEEELSGVEVLEYLDSEKLAPGHAEKVAEEERRARAETDLYAGIVRAALDAMSPDDLVSEIEKLEPCDRRAFFRAFAAKAPDCKAGSVCDHMCSLSAVEMAKEVAALPSAEATGWAEAYANAREEFEERRQRLMGSPHQYAQMLRALGVTAPPALKSERTRFSIGFDVEIDDCEFRQSLREAKRAATKKDALQALLDADEALEALGRPEHLTRRYEQICGIVRDLWS